MGDACGSPAHFIKGLRTVDQIDLKEMVLPLVVIDVHDEAAKKPDYTLSLDRVKRGETNHGPIPRRCVCRDADRLVEALAGRGKDRKQSRSRGIGVSEPSHIHGVYAENVVENVLSVS